MAFCMITLKIQGKTEVSVMTTKTYTIYRIPDKRCPDGYMKKADGSLIQKALKEGKISPNDIWIFHDQITYHEKIREKRYISNPIIPPKMVPLMRIY